MKRRNFLFGGVAIAGMAVVDKTVAKEKHHAIHSIHKSTVSHKAQHHKISKPRVKYFKPKKIHLSNFDKAILVETIWGETRGESSLGRMAVVHVILNRKYVENKFFNPKTISEVCLKKYQFSCWLDKFKMRHIKRDDNFKEIKKDVEKAIEKYEHGVDYSNGALFYYSDIIRTPKWAREYSLVNKIGLHNFLV